MMNLLGEAHAILKIFEVVFYKENIRKNFFPKRIEKKHFSLHRVSWFFFNNHKRRKKMLPFQKNSISSLLTAFILGIAPQTVMASPHFTSSHYKVTPLISNSPGQAPRIDPNLRNPFGLFFVANGDFWVADNAIGLTTLYHSDGGIADFILNAASNPTGAIFNSTNTFSIGSVANKHPASFLLVTEDGTILGFQNDVNPLDFVVAADRSFFGTVYKGIEIAKSCGKFMLFANDFHNAKTDVFDEGFNFLFCMRDETIPAGFAPFNIRLLNGLLFVTYAKQQPPDNTDDEPGPGNGFVNVFATSGALITRLISHGKLNSPWGMAVAPDTFGEFGGALLIGNQGDGYINAYDITTGDFLGRLMDSNGEPIQIQGLWSLMFDSHGTLFFSSGPDDDTNGLVGTISLLP